MWTKQYHFLSAHSKKYTDLSLAEITPLPPLLNEDTHLENLSLNYLSFAELTQTIKNMTFWLKALSNLKHR